MSAQSSAVSQVFCGRAITPQADLRSVLIRIQDGLVAAVRPNAERPTGDFVDASDGIAIPGLIDIHIHGSAGHDVIDGTYEAIDGISTHLARCGVTSFLPTVVAAPWPEMVAAMDAVREAVRRGTSGATVLGAHVEGPFLNPENRGAMPADVLRRPSVAEFERYLGDFVPHIKIMTVAPELDGAGELIRHLARRGIVVSVGHTAATYDQVVRAMDAGARNATHTYNAMRGLHHREPATVGAVLAEDRLFAELIWDNLHVHPAAAKALVRAKGSARVMLVSDAMRAAGFADGEYKLGDQAVYVREGSARLADGTLAGSIVTLDQALRNASEHFDLQAAVRMAAHTPAKALRVSDSIGSIREGLSADLVILDQRLRVQRVFVRGFEVNT